MDKRSEKILKTTFMAIGALLLMLMLQSQDALAASGVVVTVSKYEPFPATPGQTVKLWLDVQNTGTDTAKNVNVELMPQYPFTLYGDVNTLKSIPVLGPQNDYLVDYTLKVDENAVEGINTLKVKLTDGTGGVPTEVDTDVNIYVQSRDATLSIDSVKVEPSEIAPGANGNLTITVKNDAPTTLTDLTLKLYLQASVSGTLVDLPFAPIDSNAEKRIYKLDPGETAQFSYNLRAYPDAVSKVYKIPFSLTYYDSLGNQKNKSDYVGMVINSVPDISVLLDKTDLLLSKRSGSITLKFVNKGLSDIKFLTITLQKSSDYELLSTTDTAYIGNLVSDDYQTSDYTISALGTKSSITVPVRIEYRDANNNAYDRIENVQVNLIDGSKLNQAGKSSSPTFLIIVIIIIVIVGVWIYFRNRNKKSKKGQFN